MSLQDKGLRKCKKIGACSGSIRKVVRLKRVNPDWFRIGHEMLLKTGAFRLRWQ
jgi:hypothetical protein